MNTALCTGYLLKEATDTYRQNGARVLVFEAMLQADGDKEATPWHCEIERVEIITENIERLTPGRGVALRAQLAGRPFVKHGVQSGYTRFLRVESVECVKADRGRAAE